MNTWYYFWISWLVLAGAAFAVMTIIVLVGGISDLRQMFSRLTRRADANGSPSPQV